MAPVNVKQKPPLLHNQRLNPKLRSENGSKQNHEPTMKIFTTEPNYVIHWPTTLHLNQDGILCWQTSDLNVENAGTTALNELSTMTAVHQIEDTDSSPQILAAENPLDVAIKEIVTTIGTVEEILRKQNLFFIDIYADVLFFRKKSSQYRNFRAETGLKFKGLIISHSIRVRIFTNF